MRVELTFLGTGTSQGVPVIGCTCPVCRSEDPRDDRLRSSVMMRTGDLTHVIDSGPDFRQQMLREGVGALDGLVYTHEHKDHIAGMDDIRAFNFRQQRDMPLYATDAVREALEREFHYVFSADNYPGIPKVDVRRIDERPFKLGPATWWPLPVMHRRMPVLGFRVGGIAYITDANQLDPLTWERLQGADVLILNALRREKHVSHFTLDEAMEVADRVGANQTYFTHISHQLGLHVAVCRELPEGVQLAHDGLVIASEGPSYEGEPEPEAAW